MVNFELLICFVKNHSYLIFVRQFMHYVKNSSLNLYIFVLDSSHAQEVCSSQDTHCSQQTISSAQHPNCSSDISDSCKSQVTGLHDTDTNTFQGTSSSKKSPVLEVIDLSQYNTPSMPPDSLELSGLQNLQGRCANCPPKGNDH